MRTPRLALVASLALALAGCGDVPGPERQVITPEMDAKVAGRKLPKRDTPLTVGMVAPDLHEMREGAPAIVVFYRGHW
ncbi:MAG: hypothetical protein H6806_11895 [Planctomycetes bacterium]|nr:hypothetical protein [Planctomycetota bacterium]MCB9830445.1 hypothetical protein [Planctomycetota bacterium]MCB9900444.1 hypothetical protein [Planctomycetota bacterium]